MKFFPFLGQKQSKTYLKMLRCEALGLLPDKRGPKLMLDSLEGVHGFEQGIDGWLVEKYATGLFRKIAGPSSKAPDCLGHAAAPIGNHRASERKSLDRHNPEVFFAWKQQRPAMCVLLVQVAIGKRSAKVNGGTRKFS